MCALFEGGSVRCWGRGDDSQLGAGNTDSLGGVAPASDAPALELPLEGIVQSVAAGRDHTCALDDEGVLVCRGRNHHGQLGLGHADSIGDDEPVSASSVVDLGRPIRQFDAASSRTCAVRDDYALYCWGDNETGVRGLGHTDDIGDDELPIEAGPVLVFAPPA